MTQTYVQRDGAGFIIAAYQGLEPVAADDPDLAIFLKPHLYAQRDAGEIVAAYRHRPDAPCERIAEDDPELIAFLARFTEGQ